MTKPEIIPHTGTWMCSGSGVARKGRSPTAAYRNWERGMEAKAIKDAALAEVTLEVRKAEIREAYQGEIVPARTPREHRPLVLPIGLQLAGIRARAAQPPLACMTSTVKVSTVIATFRMTSGPWQIVDGETRL